MYWPSLSSPFCHQSRHTSPQSRQCTFTVTEREDTIEQQGPWNGSDDRARHPSEPTLADWERVQSRSGASLACLRGARHDAIASGWG